MLPPSRMAQRFPCCCRTPGTRYKTQVWNQSGSRPHGLTSCKKLQSCQIWMLSCGEVPTFRPCTKASKFWSRLLGTMISCRISWNDADKHQQFLDLLPAVPNLQSSWLLLVHCASARANYLLRTVCLDSVQGFAEAHDRGLWECVRAC